MNWPALALQAHQWMLGLFYEVWTYGPQHRGIREVIKPVATPSCDSCSNVQKTQQQLHRGAGQPSVNELPEGQPGQLLHARRPAHQ